VSRKLTTMLMGSMLACMAFASTGCTSYGPYLGIASFPIPVSPYVQKKQEDKFHEHERYERVPILGPLKPGDPALAVDDPSDDEVMRALESARGHEGGFPLLHEIQWNNIRILKEKIADYVDPPRNYPIVGPAQLHHAHYKCTIYYSEITRVGWPVPYTTVDEDRIEVIYIDHNHLHMVGNVDAGAGSNY
jgi:hypothetical protein